ncbi:MAG: hypothetical protein BAA04_06570 [Firmicutes bacterium ZCTH02-B6]|nr:MAG: hypothetical protein BAA04_06570 [Firmicutes bacterium ZCTH02-B6]
MAETTPVHSPELVLRFVERALVDKNPGALPICFDIAVLEKYREAGYTLFRTKSAGRVQAPEGWRLDFGIVDDAGVIHASAADVCKLPRAERQHFAAHVRTPPLNARFLKLHMGLGACVDEGDVEHWDGRPRS